MSHDTENNSVFMLLDLCITVPPEYLENKDALQTGEEFVCH